MPSDDDPPLLPPPAERPRRIGLAALVALAGLGIVLAGSFLPFDVGHIALPPSPSAPASPTAGATGIIQPIWFDDQQGQAEAMAQLKVPEAERARIAMEVAADRLRLAWIVLWDTLEEDGDTVILTSGGIAQRVTIHNTPRRYPVPYRSGEVIRLTGIHDGGGGITIGVQTTLGPIPLRRMFVGETIEIPAR